MYFENRYTVKKSMYWEFVNKILCKRMRLLGVVVALLCVIAFFLGITIEATPLLWLADAMLILVLVLVIGSPHLMLKQLMDYDKRVHGEERPECVVKFQESGILMQEGTVSIEIRYEQILCWHKLNTCDILMFTKQNGIMFKEDCFVGDASGFEKFIREKCINMKKVK